MPRIPRPALSGLVHRLSHPSTVAGMALGLMALGLAIGHHVSEQSGMEQLAAVAAERLELYAASLEAELARYDYLPRLIAIDKELMTALDRPGDAALRQRCSQKLARITARAGLGLIFIIDDHQRIVASSEDYASPTRTAETPADAIMRRLSSHILASSAPFFAATEANASSDYIMVQRLQQGERPAGHVVAVLNLAPLEATWVDQGLRSQGEKLLVVDKHDVVIMSSVPGWKYHLMKPIPSADRDALRATGLYAGSLDATLGIATEDLSHQDTSWVRVPAPDAPTNTAQTVELLAQERAVVPLDLRLVTLSDPTEVWRHARFAAWGGGAVGASLGLLMLYLAYRRRVLQQLFRASEALKRAHSELECEVSERTQELRTSNDELKHQIAQRLKAEGELIQAGKLAVLGQMSAGISHEINQPLTALRALSRNSLLLIEKGRSQTVAENLRAIDDMVERMTRITRQLKSFARKTEAAQAPATLGNAIKGARLLLDHRITAEQVTLDIDIPDTLRVTGDGNRLEQVLVNLMGNALDTMQACPQKILRISTRPDGPRVWVCISDTGPGLPPHLMARLFEPFFTTKPAGQGLGLGLVISSKIVHEFGGQLLAYSNAPDGPGMRFEFDLERRD
ncbi:sensor histidine kinase [Roseateles koreensis]|uniref:histidine kinase n=1 Tax=Roseateles koreensis TaxID=2987526 RepID=A0ABT5KVG2_9BURK|nr:ATP-binding protein [Roseateles koreensis]MDC8786926.1 ATP-binding protein [Roseateles koreensis]